MRCLALLLLPCLLAACASQPLLVPIGHAGPLSGPIEHLGRDTEQGVRLAIEELNARGLQIQGRPLQFLLVSEDDAADPRQAEPVARKLVAAGVKGVVGHLNSGLSIPAAPVYAQAGLPLLTPASSNPQLTRLGLANVFRLTPNDEAAGRLLGRHAQREWAPQQVLLVDDRTAYGQTVSAAFEAGLRDAGGSVAAREYVSDRTLDFAAQAARAQLLGAELVFYGGMDTQAAALLKALDARGWRGRFVGADGVCSTELGRLAGAALARVETWCIDPSGAPEPPPPARAAFQQRFKDRFGMPALVYAAQAYDATQVLAAALVRAGSLEPKALLPALAATRGHAGVSGEIGFDARGDLLAPGVALYTYRERQRRPAGWLASGATTP
jgi:branched-chain amino acid transport system substrate-binding protein